MTTRLKGRRREVPGLLADIGAWAKHREGVEADGLVDSYARGGERKGSNVDVMVVACDPDELTGAQWFVDKPRSELIRSMNWGRSGNDASDCLPDSRST
jgi:hypothetical protein